MNNIDINAPEVADDPNAVLDFDYGTGRRISIHARMVAFDALTLLEQLSREITTPDAITQRFPDLRMKRSGTITLSNSGGVLVDVRIADDSGIVTIMEGDEVEEHHVSPEGVIALQHYLTTHPRSSL